MSLEERTKELVERLQSALDEIDWMGRKVRPVLRDPATDEEIEAFAESEFNGNLPPSYREFLKLANGMQGADQYDWVIRGATPVDSGESFDDVRSGHIYAYKQKDENHPVVAELEGEDAPIAGTDFDYQVVYFVPSTMDDEEAKLRRAGLDTPFDHYPLFPTFTEFLAYIVDVYEDMLSFQEETSGEAALAEEEQLLRELATLLKDHEASGGGGGAGGGAAPPSEPAAPEAGGGAGEAGPAHIEGEFEPEPPPPEPDLSPEMKKAHQLCQNALEKLIQAELVELIDAPLMRENLEDYMLKKLVRSNSPQDTMDNWIYALSKAREVEELYGTDEQLKSVMVEAFEEME